MEVLMKFPLKRWRELFFSQRRQIFVIFVLKGETTSYPVSPRTSNKNRTLVVLERTMPLTEVTDDHPQTPDSWSSINVIRQKKKNPTTMARLRWASCAWLWRHDTVVRLAVEVSMGHVQRPRGLKQTKHRRIFPANTFVACLIARNFVIWLRFKHLYFSQRGFQYFLSLSESWRR